MSPSFILATLIYAVRDGRVLMLYRHKEPNLGQWIAPGGKIAANESPREGAIRELYEETGLTAVNPLLRAVVTELSPRPDWQWLMFIYRCQVQPGPAHTGNHEGRLQWFAIEEVLDLPIPQADAIFYPWVIDLQRPAQEWQFWYDDELKLSDWHRQPIP